MTSITFSGNTKHESMEVISCMLSLCSIPLSRISTRVSSSLVSISDAILPLVVIVRFSFRKPFSMRSCILSCISG